MCECHSAKWRRSSQNHHKGIQCFDYESGSNLTGPHPDARFRSCAINTGAFTEPAFKETQFHRYQPPRIPAILSGRPACFSPCERSLHFHSCRRILREESNSPDEFHVHPRYRMPRGIEAILRKVPAGFDEFVTEKYQDHIAAVFERVEFAASPIPSEYSGVRKNFLQRIFPVNRQKPAYGGLYTKALRFRCGRDSSPAQQCCDGMSFLRNGVLR